MELTLASPVVIPGPVVASCRLISANYGFADGSIQISYARLDASQTVIDTKSESLSAADVATFMATPAAPGETLLNLFAAAFVAYMQGKYGQISSVT